MKVVLLLSVVAFAAGFPSQGQYESIETDYHGKIGIPTFNLIRNAESATDFDGARIVGGSPAKISDHPHIAGLLVKLKTGQTSMCGSSLLSNTKVLTAAHCWKTANFQGESATVVLGSSRLLSGGTRVVSTDVQIHADYNMTILNYDLAMITIPRVEFTDNIKAIALPSGLFEHMTYEGDRATAVGYGRISERGSENNDALHQVSLIVIENWMCTNVFGPYIIIDSTLCTSGQGRVGPCSGDSGGPLDFTFQRTRYLIGVTSFVSSRGCQAGSPAGFVRVTSLLPWIRARM